MGGGAVAPGGTIAAADINQKTVFIGTGSQINALSTTYAGQLAYCITTAGSGFNVDCLYERNSANSAWHSVPREGIIVMYGGNYNAIPAPYLICDGSAISRTTYSMLFAIIGTTFGIGDGSTTFNLPNFLATFPRGAPSTTNPGGTGGADSKTISSGQLPTHNHGITDPGHFHDLPIYSSPTTSVGAANNQGTLATPLVTSSKTTGITVNNAGSSSSFDVRPAYLQVVFMIKI